MAKEKTQEAADVSVNTTDTKQKFLDKLLAEGYDAAYENGIVMVLATADFNKTAERVREFAKKEHYDSSFGIALKKS